MPRRRGSKDTRFKYTHKRPLFLAKKLKGCIDELNDQMKLGECTKRR